MTRIVKRPTTGSNIDWANKIKANKMLDAQNLVLRPGVSDINKKMINDLIDKMNDNIDSSYWIDNRNIAVTDLLKSVRDNQ